MFLFLGVHCSRNRMQSKRLWNLQIENVVGAKSENENDALRANANIVFARRSQIIRNFRIDLIKKFAWRSHSLKASV